MLVAPARASSPARGVTISQVEFGTMPDGTKVEAIELDNGTGMTARVLTYGATLQSLMVPDRIGRRDDVVLGYATLDDYLKGTYFLGATVGRYANRIGGAQFGFDKVVWTIVSGDRRQVTLRHVSPDGEEGFPGTLTVDVTYALDAKALTVRFAATTDRPTVVNLAHHSYWKLAGEGSDRSPLDDRLAIFADRIGVVDAGLIPSGETRSVAGTAFDFRTPSKVGARIREIADAQLAHGRGYDHSWVLPGGVTGTPRLVMRLNEPVSGRVMEMLTTEPALQFYAGSFIDGSTAGKSGKAYRQSDGLAFEAQHYPDSPNRPSFPTTRLDPGQTYRQTTVFRFSTSPRASK